jgi:hypothetical protein
MLDVVVSQRRTRAAKQGARESVKFRAANPKLWKRTNPRPQRSASARLRVFAKPDKFASEQDAREGVAEALTRDEFTSQVNLRGGAGDTSPYGKHSSRLRLRWY